jgi:Cdc6-like AAA superfamily ATPase
MKNNPFQFGNPVPPDLFINHQRQIRLIVNRILNYGQSTAVVGEPRLGKTSLIRYIISPENHHKLFGKTDTTTQNQNFQPKMRVQDVYPQLIFLYLDLQRLDQAITSSQFWKITIESLVKQMQNTEIHSKVFQSYKTCTRSNFGNQELTNLFDLLHNHNYLVVLIMDEFDRIFNCPNLANSSFLEA